MTSRLLMSVRRRRGRVAAEAAILAPLNGHPILTDGDQALATGAAGNGQASASVGSVHTTTVEEIARPVVDRRPMPQFRLVRFTFDAMVLAAATIVAPLIVDSGSTSFALLLFFDAVALSLLVAWKAYTSRLQVDTLDDVRVCVASTAIAAMAALSVAALADVDSISEGWLRLWAVTTVPLAVGRVVETQMVMRRRRRGAMLAPTVIVGAGIVGRLTARRLLAHPELGLEPVGFIDKEPMNLNGQPLPVPVLGASWDMEDIVSRYGVECVVVTFSSAPHDVMLGILDECARLGVRSLVVPRLFERVPSKLEVTHTGGLPLIEMYPTSLHNVQYAIKYTIDRLVAAVLLVILAPLLLLIAALVIGSLGRPVLYRQKRVGRDGRTFEMLKFRTMHQTVEDEDELDFQPDLGPGGVEGADRRTGVGKLLRRFSLDELAQFINVLKGEMSIVGPRPERPEFVGYFADHVRRYDARHRVKSGITGWAQIHRLRGKTSISDRVEWDNYYIENFSLWLDLKILILTIPEVFRGGGSE